jgi:predicted CXXCH cytochrome family protein
VRSIFVVFAMLVFGAAPVAADDTACLNCHAMIQTFVSKESGHPAMALGCQTCHTDHTQSAAADRAQHYLTGTPGELCITCHAEIVKKEFVHEPAKKDCTLCHDPHAGLKEGLRAQSNALCLECHLDATKSKFETAGPVKLFGGRVTLPPHYFQNLRLLALRDDRGHPVSNHPVLRDQDASWPAVTCTVCHNPHGADKGAALLVAEVENFALCQGCHK